MVVDTVDGRESNGRHSGGWYVAGIRLQMAQDDIE